MDHLHTEIDMFIISLEEILMLLHHSRACYVTFYGQLHSSRRFASFHADIIIIIGGSRK